MSAGTAPTGSGLAGLNAAQVAAVLDMRPHQEGGHYRETYRSPIVTPTPVGSRSLCTSILYLLTATDPSRFHRLRFDEMWFFHTGSPVEMVFLGPVETVVVGPDSPQALAPGGRWMAARILGSERRDDVPPPAWALVGCVVNPGFEYSDFEAGTREALFQEFPGAADLIRALS
jgi:predicted cupin superfamily sugar epimerase